MFHVKHSDIIEMMIDHLEKRFPVICVHRDSSCLTFNYYSPPLLITSTAYTLPIKNEMKRFMGQYFNLDVKFNVDVVYQEDMPQEELYLT
jgi:hypothetical protein